MAFFQATGLLGTCNTIAGILISIRKCYRAKKKISTLVSDSLSALERIKQLAPQVSRFVEVGGIGISDFCAIAAKIMGVEVSLTNMAAKLEKKNKMLSKIDKIYRFCSATETVAGLGSINSNLSRMETDMRMLISSAESNVKVSVLLEAFEPVLAVAEEIIPHKNGLKQKQRLLADARQAFGTHVLASRMNRLISRSTESMYCLIMGKMFYKGISVEVDYKKSASFFQCAISYGNSEAFGYLGVQYSWGLGMKEDDNKAVELYMKGAEMEDADCFYAMGQCFEYGYGVEKDDDLRFFYYSKAANVGHTNGQKKAAYCLYGGIGTEVDLVQSAKYNKAAAEAGDEDALCSYGHCFLFGDGVERNEKVGVTLLKMAVCAGSILALVRLGDCYCHGWGMKQDEEKAYRLYCEAAAADGTDLEALVRIGNCLVDGLGVSKNEAKGIRYLQKAAERGNQTALSLLAFVYRNGIGGEQNKRKALVSFKRAVVAGHWPSNLYLGEMYRIGEGVAVNVKRAIGHFEIYAQHERNEAHWNLGCIYESENGYMDENRALYHFRLAADLGSEEARGRVGEYFVSVSGPRKLTLTNDDLQAFLRKIHSQFYRRRNDTRTILAGQELSSVGTLDCTVADFYNSQVDFPCSAATVVAATTTSLESARETAPGAVTDAILSEFPSQKYPYRWVLALCLFHLFIGGLMSYFIPGYLCIDKR